MKTKSTLIILLFIFFISSNSNAQGRKLIVNAGANFPAGQFGDVYKAGPSAQVGIVFLSLPIVGLDLSASVEYNSFVYNNDYFTNEFKNNLSATASGFNPDWNANDFSIMVGGRIKLPGLIVNPYAEGQIGVHIMNLNQRLAGQVNASSSDPANVLFSGATETGNGTGVGTSLGVGAEVSPISKITLDFGIKYNFANITFSKPYTVFRNSNSQYTAPELNKVSFITTRAGILIRF